MVLSVGNSRIEKWVWVLIYGGLLLLGLGLFVMRADPALGWALMAAGAAGAVAGGLLVFVRAGRPDE